MADNTHETKIVINGDASVAVNALKLVNTNVSRVIGTVRGAFSILGRINWVIGGIQTLIEWTKKAHEWMHRAETAAKALREELAKSSYENAVARAADAYKKLNKNLEETLRLEKERSAIIAARKTTERDVEDADAERRKQLEISRLDPGAKNYAEQKKEIERRYEVEASDTKAARAREDARDEARSLYEQASSKDREAARLEKEWKRADAITDRAVERRWKAGMEARSGDEGAKERAKEAEEDFKKAFDFAAKIKEEMEKARKEAESLRRQAAEKTGGNLAANIRNEAEKQRIENEAKAEKAEKKRKDEEDQKRETEKIAKDQKTSNRNLEDRKLVRKKEEEIAALNPADPNYDRQKKEIERTYEIRAAEDKEKRIASDTETKVKEIDDKEREEIARLDPNEKDYEDSKAEIERRYGQQKDAVRAAGETDRQAAEEERRSIGIRHDRERAEERASLADGMANRAASFDGVSQNRLTAMGLGSGVSASGGVAGDVKKLVDLLKQQVDESKKLNEKDYSSGPATYAE